MEMMRGFLSNAAHAANGGKNNMQPGTFEKNGFSRVVAWFLFLACSLAITFRTFDSAVFSEEDIGMAELCAVLAVAIAIAATRWRSKVAPKTLVAALRSADTREVQRPFTPPRARRPVRGVGPSAEAATFQNSSPTLSLSKFSSSSDASSKFSGSLCASSTAPSTSSPADSVHRMMECGCDIDAPKLFKDIISSLHSSNGLATAEKSLGHLCGLQPQSKSAMSGRVHALIEACLVAAGARRAAEWLTQLHVGGWQPSAKTLALVMEALVKVGEPAQAEQLLSRMETADAQVDASCFQVLFQHCIAATDIAHTETWLQRIGKRSSAELTQAYVTLIRCCTMDSPKHGGTPLQSEHPLRVTSPSAVDQVDFWMSHAIDAGVAKSTKMLNAAIHAYAQVGETQKAERWLLRMEAASKQSAESHAPDVFSYSAIMDAYAQQGETEKAEAWFVRMTEVGIRPDLVSFNTLIKAHARSGDVIGAEQWLDRARKHNVQLDSFGYNAVIAAAARCGDSATAERWLRQMTQDGARPDVVTYNCVVNAWAKHGDALCAIRLVDLMLQTGVEPDVVTLGVVTHACAKAGDAQRAEGVFQKIVERGYAKPDAISYNALIDACVKAGETQRAQRWLEAMLQGGVPPSVVSYTTVLHAHARAGDIDAAERGMTRMLADGIDANVVSYSALIHACVKAGDIERAERWFQKMRSAGVRANVVSYSAILNVCAKAGDIARAEHWLETMSDDNVTPNVVCYNNIIDACAKAGRGDRAEFWLKRLCEASKNQPRNHNQSSSCSPQQIILRHGSPEQLAPTRQSYTTAAQAYATHGLWLDVERIFSQMEVGGLSMDEFSLTVLLSAYSRARPRQREKAEAAFEFHVAKGLPVTKPPLRVLRSAVGAQRFQQLLQTLPLEVRRLQL